MGMRKILIGLLAVGALGAAPAADNPYQGIFVRNVFGLKDPPPPPRPEDNLPPPPKIMLQGIATVLGKKQVLFEVEVPPQPPQPGGKKSFILEIGERQNEIEVVEIDEAARSVTFNNHGQTQVKTIEKDSAKPGNPPPTMPGLIPHPGGPTVIAPRPMVPPPGLQTIPTRSPKNPGVESPLPVPGAP